MAHEAEAAGDETAAELDVRYDALKAQQRGQAGSQQAGSQQACRHVVSSCQQIDARQIQRAVQEALAHGAAASPEPGAGAPGMSSASVSPSEVVAEDDMLSGGAEPGGRGDETPCMDSSRPPFASSPPSPPPEVEGGMEGWREVEYSEYDKEYDLVRKTPEAAKGREDGEAAVQAAIKAEQARFRAQNAIISKQLDAAAIAMVANARKLVERGKMPKEALAAVEAALSRAQGWGSSGGLSGGVSGGVSGGGGAPPLPSRRVVRIADLNPSPMITPRGEHAARAAGADAAGGSTLEGPTPDLEETVTLQ